MKHSLLSLVALTLLAGPALAQSESQEVSIPFVSHGGIDDWQADGDKGLYIKGIGKQWYYAKLFSTCRELRFANTIAFKSSFADNFDKFSSIIVDGERCPLVSLVKTEKPESESKPKP